MKLRLKFRSAAAKNNSSLIESVKVLCYFISLNTCYNLGFKWGN